MTDTLQKEIKVKQSRFPLSIFWILFGICLLMSGIHQGLIILMVRLGWSDIIQTHAVLLYWILVAAATTLHIRWRIRQTYEIPLQMISGATRKVAKGDFSVYIPTINTMDKLDYLDVMIMDINKMVEELGSIETLKTDFVSNVSHEMKTPIAVIKSSVQMLRSKNLTEEERQEYINTIDNAAERLSGLITNILKLNKLENQIISLQKQNYDVCRQLCDCILQFEDKWEDKELDIEVDTEDTAMVYADEQLMELVWNNLLSNAVKFTDPGGKILVRQISDKAQIQVSVTDTGCGMSRENMNHIFDKFYQGDTSHSMEGNGLGLALANRIVQLMDGDIQVVSEEKKGSTFTVTLPVADSCEEKEKMRDE